MHIHVNAQTDPNRDTGEHEVRHAERETNVRDHQHADMQTDPCTECTRSHYFVPHSVFYALYWIRELVPHRVPCTESHHSKSHVDLFLFLVPWNAFKQLSGKSLEGDLSYILNEQFWKFVLNYTGEGWDFS